MNALRSVLRRHLRLNLARASARHPEETWPKRYVLIDLLPGGLGNDINWHIDGSVGNPSAFAITGVVGSQALILSSSETTLAPGASLKVHITGLTTASDAGTLSNTAALSAVNEAPSEQNDQASAAITVVSQAGGPLVKGQTATIGFWHNKNGQAVINNFNGGSGATTLFYSKQEQFLKDATDALYGR